MKKLMILTVGILFIGLSSFAVAQNMASNPGFENWTDGLPDDWYGTKSNIGYSNVVQYTTSVHGDSSACQLIRTSGSHKRFTTQGIPVTAGTEYTINFWVRGHGDIRTGLYDGGWHYNSYISINSSDWAQYTQTVTASNTSDAAEFIFSLKNTNPDIDHIQIDDVEILPPSGSPEISNAYTVSLTALDVLYNQDISSVDPADYTLTGTATITFSSATIDSTNAKLVHLTGASANMIGDTTLDNIEDTANSTDYDFYAGIMPIANTNTLNPGGTISNNITATFTGIVSAIGPNKVWISDASGAYNGVLIYDYDFDEGVNRGDSLLIYAIRDEFYNLTELKNPELVVPQTPSTPYAATVINGSEIADTLSANTNPGEKWEGQLVRIDNAVIVSTAKGDYIATDDDSTTYFHISDFIYSGLTLNIGATYKITGVVDWYSNHYEILPRDADDIIPIGDPYPVISDVQISPDPPLPDSNVVISAIITDASKSVDSAFVYWSLDEINFTELEMSYNSGTGRYEGTIPGQSVGTTVYYYLRARDDVGQNTYYPPEAPSVTESYYISAPPANYGDVIINEIMQNPAAVSDGCGEYFELYNTTDEGIDINGWVIKDKDYDSHTIDNGGSLIISAHSYLVLGNNADTLLNGNYHCDYEYSGFYLSNSDDEIILVDGTVVIDSVYYDGGPVFPDPTGASMELDPAYQNADDNDNGANWYEAYTPYGDGDKGTPGSPNPGPQAPTPENVTIVISDTNVVITWSPGAKTTYNIYRSTNPYSNFIKIDSLITDTTYTDYGAANEIKYFYYITAE